MRPDRLFTTVLVALLVAVAGFAGAATAAEPAGDTVVNQQQGDVQSVTISEMVLQNLSTDMQLEGATITVETAEGTRQISVESATVVMENATVDVSNATLEEGMVSLESANVTITEGQIDIQSSQGDMSMDLSNTDRSVEEVTIDINEMTREELGLSGDLSDVTIQEMTVEGISGTTDVGLMVANMQVESERGSENMSISMQNGSVEVQGASMTLQNATVQDGTLMVESVNGSVESAQVQADRVVLLQGFDLQERRDFQRSVQNEQFSAQNVEMDVEQWVDLLEQLFASQMAAAA